MAAISMPLPSAGPRDRDALTTRFLPLARHLAARYTRGGEPFDDVYQVACIGLINAVDRYDSSRGTAFTSYAVPTIVGEIKRYYRDRTWAVHVSRDLLEATLRVEAAAEDLASRLGRPATVADIAARLSLSEQRVREAQAANRLRRTVSIEEPCGNGDEPATVGERIAVDEPGFERAEDRATLERLMRCLSEREREAVRLRFVEDLSQDEIGARLGISQMQVSRVLRAAMERLEIVAGHML
ncbi:MAG TPA: SigB/SigF/SigG family RNA polymerase sigma factor [Solirubrobacteraceae bacterium]